MKLPAQLLSTVRGSALGSAACGSVLGSAICGSALVAALAGCAGPEAAAIVPEAVVTPAPSEHVAIDAVAIDPVAYDEVAEARRLDATELEVGADAARRTRRIAFNVARASTPSNPPVAHHPPSYAVRCGRG